MKVAAIEPANQALRSIEGKSAILLVIDCSNAAGGKIIALKALALQLVNSLREGQRFTLMVFGNGVLTFDDALYEATAKTKELASRFLECIGSLGDPNLEHALGRALGMKAAEDAEILLLAAHAPSSLRLADPQASEPARIFHIIEYEGSALSPLRGFAQKSGGNYITMAAPAESPAVPPAHLPRKYDCYGTALLRLKRSESSCSPAWLSEQLQQYALGDISSVVGKMAPEFSTTLTELRESGLDETLLTTCFRLALKNLQHLGGLSWRQQEAIPKTLLERRIYLELRILAFRCCRDWCHQELVFNPNYTPDDIPAFLLRNEQKENSNETLPSIPGKS